MKCLLFIFMFLFIFCGFSQSKNLNYNSKRVAVKDTIQVDSVSISSHYFLVRTLDKVKLDSALYHIDFSKAILTFKQPLKKDSLVIEYLKYPDFLTKTYSKLDDRIIVENNSTNQVLYKLSQSNTKKNYVPFDGLTTSGSISRGITVGNNQNSVLNNELDLQITGKLNDNLSIRASIQDANIPLQENGYSQRLDEFDQVFIELLSNRWSIRAGDIDLVNTDSYFSSFSKRVQGLNFSANFGKEDRQTKVFAAGAIVRGQFTTSQFIAQEGNQGPYKLEGQNGELFVLIVSGSETVYVNGIAVKRGEDQDYIIDYNAGEIIFNSTFPMTSEMRVTVDYQFSDRNYSRFVAYGGANYTSEKLNLGVSIYSENDAKNQPLQQNLSKEQAAILSKAGDDASLMVAPSEVITALNENRILYKKELISGTEAFVFSNNPDDELYQVTFSLVGSNKGDYIISDEFANPVNTIYQYVGVNLGNYAPVIQLFAPVKLDVAVVNGSYKPSDKTSVLFEGSASKNDLNLFSNSDDNNNDGYAGKMNFIQSLIKRDSLWNLNVYVDSDYINSNYRNIEGLYNPEFNRDWNLDQTQINGIGLNLGDQLLLHSGFKLFHQDKGLFNYQYEHLNFTSGFNGNRHVVHSNLNFNKFLVSSSSSLLKAESNLNRSTFFRTYNRILYTVKKNAWVGARLMVEDNRQKDLLLDSLTPLSQKFNAYEAFIGIGDSTKIFTEFGYKNRVNDSIRNNRLQKVNSSNTFYVDSKFIQNKNTNLSLFANYRRLKYVDTNFEDEESINSRLQFSQKLFKQILQLNVVYETNSGRIPQQDFTYVEVEAGQGTYTWIDYNTNGIQELEEFEIAPFQDQGKFIRVLLPNRIFIKTHQNRWSQTLTINPAQWAVSENKSQKFWSHFYNQSSYLLDRKMKRDRNNFNLSPFYNAEEDRLGLQLNFRNVLFFNRGKQRYTSSYTFLSNATRNVLSLGSIENNLKSHQLNFNHKIAESWLINLLSIFSNNESENENFTSRNFNFMETKLNPKLSYLFSDNSSFDLFYQHSNKENTIGGLETLMQQKYGASFTLSGSEKGALSGEVNYFVNDFNGNTNTPVAYQILEGLQPGKNFTWTLLAQKKLTKYLDLNLNYFGRKTQTSKVIHTGTVQLKAFF